jgi:integrase
MNKPLTQRIIDTTPLPQTGFKELRERGLVLRIYATGGKAWSFEFRSPVTLKSARISFEATSLAEARAIVQRRRVELSEGKDPNLERKEAVEARRIEHKRAMCAGDALDAYALDFVTGDKVVSRRDRMARLRRAVEPFVTRPVASLTKGDIITRLDEVQANSGPIARNRAQAEIRAWLGWLHERDIVPTIALMGIRKKIDEKPFERTRVLTDAEIGVILTETADGSAFSDIVRVLLHTGMRKGEAANLQPRDLDFVARTIKVRVEVAKTNRGRVIPMAEAIAPMLKMRAEGLARDGYIFGEGSGFRAPFSGWGKSIDRLREDMPEGDPWTLHDIRRTVATRLHDAGVDTLVVEDVLGHLGGARNGVAGVYNRAVTLTKQREALKSWAERLALLAGDNVIPFAAGRSQAIGQTR